MHLAHVKLSLGLRDLDSAQLEPKNEAIVLALAYKTIVLQNCTNGEANGNYTVNMATKVGGGANGDVYKAKKGQGPENIAMKFSKHADTDSDVKRLKNEAEIMARVKGVRNAMTMLAACTVSSGETVSFGSYVILMPWLPPSIPCSSAVALHNQNVIMKSGKLGSSNARDENGFRRKDASFVSRMQAFIVSNVHFFCDMTIEAGLVDTDRRLPGLFFEPEHNIQCILGEDCPKEERSLAQNCSIAPLHYDFDAAVSIDNAADDKIKNMWTYVVEDVAKTAGKKLTEECEHVDKPVWELFPLIKVLKESCEEQKALTFFQDFASQEVCKELRRKSADNKPMSWIQKVKNQVGCRD